jgi:hypothetical protein
LNLALASLLALTNDRSWLNFNRLDGESNELSAWMLYCFNQSSDRDAATVAHYLQF